MTKVVILGAGEHGRTVEEKCRILKYEVLGYLDDTMPPGELVNDVPVLGQFERAFGSEFGPEVSFHVALGDTGERVAIGRHLMDIGRNVAAIVHPRAEVARTAEIGAGAYVGVFATLGVNVRIADFVLVNGYTSVSADAVVDVGAWLAPGCLISRGARIGRESHVGTGAIVLPDVTIGENCTIGAGSLVTKDIPDNSVAYGSPCRIVEQNR